MNWPSHAVCRLFCTSPVMSTSSASATSTDTTGLDSTWHDWTWLYMTRLDLTLHDMTGIDSTWHESWLYVTRLDSYVTPLYCIYCIYCVYYPDIKYIRVRENCKNLYKESKNPNIFKYKIYKIRFLDEESHAWALYCCSTITAHYLIVKY